MAEGDIGAVIDSLEFDGEHGASPWIIHISGNVYAIVYAGADTDGFLITVTIAADGMISNTVIDSWEYDTVNGTTPNIIHVSGNVYAIAYTSDLFHGWLVTVTIAANGTITKSFIDSLEYETSLNNTPKIIHVSGNVYAIIFEGAGNDGFLVTVTISTDGTISNAVVDSWEYDTTNGKVPNIIHISGNVYAIPYQGAGSDGFLVTISIATDGTITKAWIDSLKFEDANCYSTSIVHVSGDVYAIAYCGTGFDGFLVTVTIAADGMISDTVVDSWEFNTTNGWAPDIRHVSGNVYAIAYQGLNANGWLATVTIATDGTITKAWIDSLEFDNLDCAEANLLHITGNIYGIAYQGESGDGFLKTVDIETVPPAKPHHEMMMGMGP